jgi:hypothetical protein
MPCHPKIIVKKSKNKRAPKPAPKHQAGSKSAAPAAGKIKKITPLRAKEIEAIERLHDELRAATRLTAQKAIELGGRLVKLKKAVGHGGWLLFVKENFTFCAKTAERYMDVYRNRAHIEKFDNVSDLKISDAYEIISKKKEKKTVADPAGDKAGGDGAGGEPDKGALLTGISRSLCDGLERLAPNKLKEFGVDLLEFKQSWLKQHAGEVEK